MEFPSPTANRPWSYGSISGYRSERVTAANGLGESLDEAGGGVGDLPPAAVDCERVPAVRDLGDLGHALVALLPLVGGVRDRPRDRVVLLARNDEQRSPIRILGVHLGFGPRVEVGSRRLEERSARRRYSERVVQLFRLALAHGVGEREAELLVGERDRSVAIGRVAEDRRRRLERGDRQRQHAAEGRRI